MRVRVGCDFLFYEARNVVLDADGFRQSPNSFRLQPTVPFHLDRIDQPALPVNGEFVWNATGQSVTVFILDSVRQPISFACSSRQHEPGHSEGTCRIPPWETKRTPRVLQCAAFATANERLSRARHAGEAAAALLTSCLDVRAQVASVVAGNLLGVAKEATLIDVAALRCPRTKKSANPTRESHCWHVCHGTKLLLSSVSILAGLRFVEENAADSLPAILLLPFHLDGIDPGVEDMISRVYEKGIFVVASAGDKAGEQQVLWPPASTESSCHY